MVLKVYDKMEDAQSDLANALARIIDETEGEVRLALGGGRTPEPTYARLREILQAREVDGRHIRVFVTDDNVAQNSNERMVSRVLCEPLGIPCAAPSRFADHYLDRIDKPVPLFHAAVLGLGADGHTAALFSAAENAEDDPVLRTEAPNGEGRVSMGLTTLAQAQQVFLMAAGFEKSAAVETLFCGGQSSGAIVARWSQTTCLVDAAAGQRLIAEGEQDENFTL